jgi:hypothetical protein
MADLKRLVYSPKAYAFIYSRKKNGAIIDVSNDISGGAVQRFVNKPSTASLTLRNDNWKYTGRFQPTFFPMDGITIWLQRFAGRPVQVFTGFIDTIPYYQAYPGEIEITATCTLKQFMYTHFDPGTGFLQWLTDHGWVPNQNNGNMEGFYNPDALSTGGDSIGTDGGMGQLLHDFMIDIGGVDPNAIVIGDLPKDLPQTMLSAYTKKVDASKAAQNSLIATLGNLLSINVSHTADQSSDLNSKFPTGISQNAKPSDIKEMLSALDAFRFKTPRPNEVQMILAAIVMSGLDKDYKGTSDRSPSLGEGFFADPNVAAKATGSHGASRGTEDRSAKKQGEDFCQRWQEVIKTTTAPTPSADGSLTEEMVAQTAKVLAYGYDKAGFYAQILESCNNSSNQRIAQQVLNNINANKGLEGITSLDILSAGEVAENVNPLNVTWDALFNSELSNDSSTVETMTQDGKNSSGGLTSVQKNKTYKTRFGCYVPKSDLVPEDVIPRVKKQTMSYTEVEYYVHSVGETKVDGTQAKLVSKYIEDSGIGIGQIILVKNPKTNKKCRCIYMGPATGNASTKSALTISQKALEILGDPNKKDGEIAKDEFTFQVLEEKIPNPPADDASKKPADLKKEYLNSIKGSVGAEAKQSSNQYFDSNINETDKNIYEKWYASKTNNRLAEYFYIASNYNLHLVDFEKTDPDRIALQGDPAQIVEFLKHTGMASESSSVESGVVIDTFFQSVPKGIQVTLNGGSTLYQINPNAGTNTVLGQMAALPEPIKSASSKGIQGIVVIEANTDYPKPIWDGATVRLPQNTVPDGNENTGGDIKSATTWSDIARIATSAAFSTLTAFPWDLVGSSLLIGEKSLMNDVPVMQGIEQLCKGSMRKFMSLPNGMFCAFYPDEFGRFGRKPYMSISDVEIIDFNIVLNDEPVVTHMYVNGQTTSPLVPSVNQTNQIMSVGVITIDDVLSGNLNIVKSPESVTGITGDASDNSPENISATNAATPEDYPQFNDGLSKEALEFLQVYGTRPLVQNEPLIRSPWFEFATAYNEFAHHWAMHTATTVTLTFMPEIMTGGLVKFDDQNIIMYVEGVNHTWNYSSGFETSAYLSSPSTDDKKGDGVPGLVLFNSKL